MPLVYHLAWQVVSSSLHALWACMAKWYPSLTWQPLRTAAPELQQHLVPTAARWAAGKVVEGPGSGRVTDQMLAWWGQCMSWAQPGSTQL